MATDINILIKATDQASAPTKKVEGEIKNLGNTAKSSATSLGGLGNALKTGLTVGLVGAAAAIGGLAFAFKDSLTEARNQIQADKQLEQVIKSTGEAAGVSAQQAKDLAGSLSLVTNFGDDAIESGESLLLTFTGIGKDVFPRATETMLDMSQALGQDMKSSAVQLGKALNDPINGMTALSRVGVSFTDQQKEMITTMQEAGDVAGAQGVILDELSKEFGGSAKGVSRPRYAAGKRLGRGTRGGRYGAHARAQRLGAKSITHCASGGRRSERRCKRQAAPCL
jgi:phage-related minor tail protein